MSDGLTQLMSCVVYFILVNSVTPYGDKELGHRWISFAQHKAIAKFYPFCPGPISVRHSAN